MADGTVQKKVTKKELVAIIKDLTGLDGISWDKLPEKDLRQLVELFSNPMDFVEKHYRRKIDQRVDRWTDKVDEFLGRLSRRPFIGALLDVAAKRKSERND